MGWVFNSPIEPLGDGGFESHPTTSLYNHPRDKVPGSAWTIPGLRPFKPETISRIVSETAFTPTGRALRTRREVRSLPSCCGEFWRLVEFAAFPGASPIREGAYPAKRVYMCFEDGWLSRRPR